LCGIGSGSTTSKAERRSVVTISIALRVDGVDVADLAGVDGAQVAQRRAVHGRGGGCGGRAFCKVGDLPGGRWAGLLVLQDEVERKTRRRRPRPAFGP
jgi:hypothetical protein